MYAYIYLFVYSAYNTFYFSNILNLNKLVKYFIDASINKNTSKDWDP